MGPLSGMKILEIGSIGPGPFAAMVLTDLGASTIRVDRPAVSGPIPGGGADLVNRGRPVVTADLKTEEGRAIVLDLVGSADALIEGFRPGVMERLGLGPDVLLARNPRLVFGRMTGYGQTGPLSQVPGHDVNYISVAGPLGAMARAGERPLFPMNLLGDYGAGGMLLALGILAAVHEAARSGRGQVVDAAMVDGAALLSTAIHGLRANGLWSDEPGTNVLDSGAHFYEVYETADAGFVSVGAIEPQFYGELLRLLDVEPDRAPQWDRDRWPELKELFAERFRTRTREQWAAILEPADACATVVQGLAEAPRHPHNVARGTFFERDGVVQPAAAPRFGRTPADADHRAPTLEESVRAWGLPDGVADRVLGTTVPGP